MNEDAPAVTGEVRIAHIRGLGGYVLRRWPVWREPEVNLIVRERDEGEIYLAIEGDCDWIVP
jgi:hypothetical protein